MARSVETPQVMVPQIEQAAQAAPVIRPEAADPMQSMRRMASSEGRSMIPDPLEAAANAIFRVFTDKV